MSSVPTVKTMETSESVDLLLESLAKLEHLQVVIVDVTQRDR